MGKVSDEMRRAGHVRTSSGASLNVGLARDLSEIARELQAEPDTQTLMQRIVEAAVREIPGCTGSAITLLDHGKISSPVHSDDVARRVGLAQEDTGEGPCVDTSREEVTLRCDDLRADSRWPRWAAAAAESGVRSALSFQLFVEGQSMGALDVYANEANAFDEAAENTGLLLALHAAIAMSASRKVDNLRVGLTTRDLIGQAKGILMERFKIPADQAFQLLVVASQRQHRKLRDVAEELTTTGGLSDL